MVTSRSKISMMIAVLLVCLAPTLINAQDTSCGIAWGPPTPLSGIFGFGPKIAAVGDTVHVTWAGGEPRLPYLRSVNGGMTWEPTREMLTDTSIFDYPANDHFVIANHSRVCMIFIGGNNGGVTPLFIMISTDRGDTWSGPTPILHDTSSRFDNVAMLGDTIIADIRPTMRLARSTDGGKTWTNSNTPFTPVPGYRSYALTPGTLHHVFMDWSQSTSEISYRQSNDLGDTWTDSILLSDVDGYTSDYPAVGTTADDAGNWHLLATWRDGKYGYRTMVGGSVILRQSTDVGSTWSGEDFMTNLPNGYNTDQSTGQIASAGSVIGVVWTDDEAGHIACRFSTNTGATWSQLCDVTPGRRALLPTCAVSGNIIHVVWEDADTSSITIRTMYRRGEILSTGVENGPTLPTDNVLQQNYPNPFNPSTRIAFAISQVSHVSLTIYDLLGREVGYLADEQLLPGTYERVWDAAAYPAGVYFGNLRATPIQTSSKSVSEWRKMLLVK